MFSDKRKCVFKCVYRFADAQHPHLPPPPEIFSVQTSRLLIVTEFRIFYTYTVCVYVCVVSNKTLL